MSGTTSPFLEPLLVDLLLRYCMLGVYRAMCIIPIGRGRKLTSLEEADVLWRSLIIRLMCNIGRLFVDRQSLQVSIVCINRRSHFLRPEIYFFNLCKTVFLLHYSLSHYFREIAFFRRLLPPFGVDLQTQDVRKLMALGFLNRSSWKMV